MSRFVSSWLMTTSFLFLEILTLRLLVWRETGLRAVVSSITRIRPSSPGLMRKISSGSSPCKVEEMSELSLTVLLVASRLLEIQSKPNLERISCLTPSMVMSTPAQPTWELVGEHQYTLPSRDTQRKD